MRLLPAETWRRNQLAVTLAAGLLFFGFTLVMPFLPYFIESLGARGAEVEIWSGLVLFTAPFLAALMGPIWGRMVDRYGMKIMLQRIVAAMTLHWLLMYFVDSLAHLMVLRVLLGLFSGFGAISVALVTHGVPEPKVGGVVGTLQSAQILSAAVGPAVGGVLFDRLGIRPTFLITASICAVGFVLVTLAYREIAPGQVRVPGEAGEPLRLRQIAATGGLLPILALLFFANLVDRSFGVIVPLVLQDMLRPGTALGTWNGLTISGGALAGAASALWLGRRAGRGRPRRRIQLSLTVGAALLAGMAISGSAPSFAALRLAYGFGAGGLVTLAYSLASGLVGTRSRATSYGFLSSGALLGAAIGPLASGLLAPLIGFRGFLAGSAAVLLCLALAARSGVRRERREGEPEALQPPLPLPR